MCQEIKTDPGMLTPDGVMEHRSRACGKVEMSGSQKASRKGGEQVEGLQSAMGPAWQDTTVFLLSIARHPLSPPPPAS